LVEAEADTDREALFSDFEREERERVARKTESREKLLPLFKTLYPPLG
jgi:hypothetical protein